MKNIYNHKEGAEKNPEITNVTPGENMRFISQFYVFQDDRYLGWDCYEGKRVTVGKSPAADLVLPDNELADVHAVFFIDGNRILVSNEGWGIRVNEKPVANSIIGPFDTVSIGKYTLKIKLKKLSGNLAGTSGFSGGDEQKKPPEKRVRCGVDDVLKELLNDKQKESEGIQKHTGKAAGVHETGGYKSPSENPEYSQNTPIRGLSPLSLKQGSVDSSPKIKDVLGKHTSALDKFLTDPLYFFDDVDFSVEETPSSDVSEANDTPEEGSFAPDMLSQTHRGESESESKPVFPEEGGKHTNLSELIDNMVTGQQVNTETIESEPVKPHDEIGFADEGIIETDDSNEPDGATQVETKYSPSDCHPSNLLLSEIEAILDELLPDDPSSLTVPEISADDITLEPDDVESESVSESDDTTTSTEPTLSELNVTGILDELFPDSFDDELLPDDGAGTEPLHAESQNDGGGETDECEEDIFSRVNSADGIEAFEAENRNNQFQSDIRVQVSKVDKIVDELFDDMGDTKEDIYDDSDVDTAPGDVVAEGKTHGASAASERPDDVIDFFQYTNRGNDIRKEEQGVIGTMATELGEQHGIEFHAPRGVMPFHESGMPGGESRGDAGGFDPLDVMVPGIDEDNPAIPADDDEELELSLFDGFDEVYDSELSGGEIQEFMSETENGTGYQAIDESTEPPNSISDDDFDKIVSALSKPNASPQESVMDEESVDNNVAYEPVAPVENNSFAYDDDDEEDDDDVPATFSLREKLTVNDKAYKKKYTGQKVVEIVRFHKDRVLDVLYVTPDESMTLVESDNKWCEIEYTAGKTIVIRFNDALSGIINRTGHEDLNTEKLAQYDHEAARHGCYQAQLPEKGETLVSDGTFEYLFRPTFIQNSSETNQTDAERLPIRQRVLQSTAFRYASKAALVHLIVLIVLSFTVKAPVTEDPTKEEPRFVVLETKNIHKPVKPKKKPKPVAVKPKPVKKEKKKKQPKKIKPQNSKVASMKSKKRKKVVAEKSKAGGGHKGNIVNRNINNTGLLGTLGIADGVSMKPNKALAAVTNIDAVTSTRSREARVKVGGIVGSLGEKGIALTGGEAFISKGSASALRSAGISGKGSVAALESGKTGNRAVAGAVSAPLTKSVKFKGGGISREAVAKVINEHIDEINYCYETALISDPSLMGKVVFEWKILTSGRVGEVKIKSSTIRSDSIHSCIKSAIRSWKFPKPKGAPVVVSYPFVFDVAGF